jgi:hypothetical protein
MVRLMGRCVLFAGKYGICRHHHKKRFNRPELTFIIIFIVLLSHPYLGLPCGLLSVIYSDLKFVPISPSLMRTTGPVHTTVTCASYTLAKYEPLL